MSTAVTNQNRNGQLVQQEPAQASVAMLDRGTFDQMWRVAMAMARGSLCPKHLKGRDAEETAANCLRVVNQAYRWGFDPFAVADESYVVGGKLSYQGKLVMAVVNARAGIVGRLAFEHHNVGTDGLFVICSATFEGDSTPSTIELTLAQAKTANDMWKKDPEQKICYSAAIKWARRHCPEVVMGVLTVEELEAQRSTRPTVDAPQSLSDLSDSVLGAAEPTEDADAVPDAADDVPQAADGSEEPYTPGGDAESSAAEDPWTTDSEKPAGDGKLFDAGSPNAQDN